MNILLQEDEDNCLNWGIQKQLFLENVNLRL